MGQLATSSARADLEAAIRGILVAQSVANDSGQNWEELLHAGINAALSVSGPGGSPTATTVTKGISRVDNNGAGDPVALTATGHLLDADPHPQYALDSEKGAASGLATLDGTSKLTASQLPLGTSASTAAAGNDARLSDARTPLAHAASHAALGSDPVTLTEAQITGLTTDLAAKEITANKAVASGYASLDGTTKVPIAQLPTGITSVTVPLGNDTRFSDARTPTAHATESAGGFHTASGLTTGWVLRATGATTFAFQALVAADIPSLDTTKITTSRFIAARLLDGLNGFVLMGKGTGADPAYASVVTTRLTVDNSAIAAGTVPAQVTGLTQAVNANEEWDLEWILDLIPSVTTDVYIFSVTASAVTLSGEVEILGQSGAPNTGAGVAKHISLAVSTNLVGSTNCPGNSGSTTLKTTVRIRARIKQVTNAATISVNVRAVTSGALTSGTCTVKAQSQLTALRIA